MSVLFVFPGQGSQTPGMLHQLPQHAACHATLAEAEAALGRSPLLLDTTAALQSTVAVQLCLLIAGVASARLLQAEDIQPHMVAGLSIGAFPAAVIAGVLDFHHAVQLVQLRGQLMEQAYPQGYGMCAITGLALPQLQNLLDKTQAAGQQVYLANINAEQQLVVAGSDAGLQAISQVALQAGAARCQRLAISVPSHCCLLDQAAQTLAQTMRDTPLHAPACLYLSANAARVLRSAEQIRDDLPNNMAREVHWHDTARLAWERGARLAVEMLPGTTLSRLLKPVFSQGVVMTVADDRLDSLQYTTRRMAQDDQY
ncbi:malonate decarboxylase subunit epsilon [Aquitalea sp. LB_tupeE]|uniref:malonate decarboxylase subunit epsilon n=1 Tax=Aquitalea sp. LB_tupeE TaxID=2748078 RepID=UPI0015B80090|nr:malonate decarboxylase subunit epsilon [Aquitalea sp. LB_tupeE]NWK79721.1 malonate decarboxylase subunit epsilon [Aquitalea sp. LB_tupeE]